jgi:uncharacterized protein (DUF4415 family)
MRENRKHTTRVSGDEARHLKDETDYARLDAMTDADIAQAVAEDPDAPPLDLDWTQARLSLPPAKDVVTLRLDRDVLEWFRAQGKGYQTRINQVLRAFYEARRNPLADVVDGVTADATAALARDQHATLATMRAELARDEQARREREEAFEKAHTAKKHRAAKQAAKATVAKQRA